MKDLCQWSNGPAVRTGIQLDKIWRVDVGDSYRVTKDWQDQHGLIALRTVAGEGRMQLKGIGQFQLPAGSLLIMERSRITHYRTQGNRWSFWWFEFMASDAGNLPLHQVLAVPADERERYDLETCFEGLGRDDVYWRGMASATLGVLLHRWIITWKKDEASTQDSEQIVSRCIQRMRTNMSKPVSICELASAEGISPRWFRKLFAQQTHMTPKQYYDTLRLDIATEMLRMGGWSVSQISERLGFSSPFHFSRAFRKRFGVPPSKYE